MTRDYDADALRRLMDHIGEWARDWDDVQAYLARDAHDTALDAAQLPALREDVGVLQRDNMRFTRDYRKIWQRLTGEPAEHLPPPMNADPRDVDPVELRMDYLNDVEFPADKREIMRAARTSGAPSRIIDRIEALDDRRHYRDSDELLEELDDADWNPPQRPERTRIPGRR